MTSVRLLFTLVFAPLVLVVACGGAHPKSPGSGGASGADSASADDSETPGGASSGGDGSGGPALTPEAAHQQYLKGCSSSPELGPFCECSWTVVTTVLTPKQVQGDIDAYTKKQLMSEVRSKCLSKYPEKLAKAEYIGECAKAANEMTAFCTCRWTQLRKSLSIAELKTPETAQTQKFMDLRKPVAKACSSKLSETSVADGFEQGCNKRPALGAFCKCAWKEVRARMSLGEIADPGSSESPEFKAAMDAVGTKCQAFRPAE